MRACSVDDVELEDVIAVPLDGRRFAVYRSPDDTFYATDGLCTHEHVMLADGLVSGHLIECPKHNGRFDYRTGTGVCAPITTDLRTFPVKVEDGIVFIDVAD